jgi:hypothetical protein
MEFVVNNAGSATIAMKVENPAIPDSPSVIIHSGVTAVLNISLSNNTGADITLNARRTVSQLTIFLPQYFTAAEVQAMRIENISETQWTSAYDEGSNAFVLTCGGTESVWENRSVLSFTIANVLTALTHGTDDLQINYDNLRGQNIPLQTGVAVSVSVAPPAGAARLRDTLLVTTACNGVVFVSTPDRSLSNELFINFRNINPAVPLYSGKNPRPGNPRVTITFVYGRTSGALAPADRSGTLEQGSAWAIAGAIGVDQTRGWTIRNPAGAANSPSWVITPLAVNQELIGTQEHSNVSFRFNNIVSFTPVGATQAYVHFTGFMRDDTTPYADETFVVPIAKQHPPNPSVLGTWSLADRVTVQRKKDEVVMPIMWAMFGVGSVELSFHFPGLNIASHRRSYGTSPALHYDTHELRLTGIPMSGLLTIYCTGYSDNNFMYPLNKAEGSVPVDFPPVIVSFSIDTAEIVPPASYAFQLKWDIEGASYFQLTADDGSGPQLLPVPQNVSAYLVTPENPLTTYTLNIYGPHANII